MADFSGDNSLNRFKKDKYFKPLDLIVYIVIALIVATSVIALILINKNDDTDGFKLLKNGDVVFLYSYKTGIKINDEFDKNIKINSDGTITVTFDGQYNTIKINDDEKWVQVVDANCKTHDCITAGKLKSSGLILCLHNNVKILPLNSDDGITIGGIL